MQRICQLNHRCQGSIGRQRPLNVQHVWKTGLPYFRIQLPDAWRSSFAGGEGANGCVWDSTVTILEPDVLVLDLGPDVSVQLGDAIPLWNLSDLNDPERLKTLSVEPAYLTVALCDTCKLRLVNSLRNSLTVRDSNGCIATDKRIIAVEKKRRVYFPNIFNPDNPDDGQMFSIYCGQDVAQVRYLKVQNRWGQTVFKQQNFAPMTTRFIGMNA